LGESEAKTRKKRIDPRLIKAGWKIDDQFQVIAEVDTKQSNFKKKETTRPLKTPLKIIKKKHMLIIFY